MNSSLSLEMQVRALVQALDSATRATAEAQHEVTALRELIRLERLRSADIDFRLKQIQQTPAMPRIADVAPDAENEALKDENRRLRKLIGESAIERNNLIEEIRIRAPFSVPPKEQLWAAIDTSYALYRRKATNSEGRCFLVRFVTQTRRTSWHTRASPDPHIGRSRSQSRADLILGVCESLKSLALAPAAVPPLRRPPLQLIDFP
jgi:hypothetical protein